VDNVLLFITGVLSGLIAGFIISRVLGRTKYRSDGSTESLLQERLLKADDGLKKFSDELEAYKKELKETQIDAQRARETAVVSSTQLKAVTDEKELLKSEKKEALDSLEELRQEKEKLSTLVGEVSEKLRSQENQKKYAEQARADLLTEFKALSADMLKGSRDYLVKTTEEKVTTPFSKQVEILRKQVEDLSKDSTEKLGALAQSTRDLKQRSEDVQGAAQQLTSALRSPNVKGQWGEVNLKRILEFVGLISYCDFNEQVNLGTNDGTYRPDCVITIPGSRRLVVDSKAPIESYLDALKATDEREREEALTEHLKKVRSHVDQLSKKDYSSRFDSKEQVVDGVILFIPIEGALSMALERDPSLLEYAFSKNIVLTFPTSLLAILKGLAMTIQQAEIAKNIDEIQSNAVELYKRFSRFTDRFNTIGTNITRLNKSFNDAVGTYERSLLPQGRRFAEMAGQNSDLNLTDGIEGAVREIKDQDVK